MPEISISDAVLKAFRNAERHTWRTTPATDVGGAAGVDLRALTAGLQAGIRAWLGESTTFAQLAAAQGVQPRTDTAGLAIDGITDEERVAFLAAVDHDRHVYLSTACYHGEHGYCSAMTGYQGEKRPSQCKFCDARCICTKCNHGHAPATPASAGEPKATNEGVDHV